MFIVYFALWVILNGKWTTEIGVRSGVRRCAVRFSCRRRGTASRRSSISAQALGDAATARRCHEIFKANITQIRMILTGILSRSLSLCILKAVCGNCVNGYRLVDPSR